MIEPLRKHLEILIVEDYHFNIMAMQLMLDQIASKLKLDLDIASAVNGLEGLKVLGEKRFDLVFVDLNMPVMNGLEMMQRLKDLQFEVEKASLEKTIFILCTAQSEE